MNGKLYVAGGAINSDFNTPTGVLEIYDPATNSWTTGAPMPVGRPAAVAGVINGKLYVAGGQSTSPYAAMSNLDIYDPATNSWSPGSPLPVPVGTAVGTVINGKLYVAGGYTGPSSATPVAALQIYDPGTNSWSSGPAMAIARGHATGAAVYGKFYITGGFDAANQLRPQTEVYDPASGSWSFGPSSNIPRYWAASVARDSQMFTVGGWIAGPNPPGNSFEILSLPRFVQAVRTGDIAAGISNAKFTSFGVPAMNEENHTAFYGVVTGLNGAATTALAGNNSGIWADDSTGTRQLVVRKGDSAPGTTNAVFAGLTDVVYNNNEEVAFLGSLKPGVGDAVANPSNLKGIWANNGGTLHLVARTLEQAPGCPSGVVFKTINRFVLPDQGGVVLLATLSGTAVTSANNQGIWAVDSAGELQLVARKGDEQPGTGKLIKALSFLTPTSSTAGQTRNFAHGTGDISYRATLSDGTSAVFTVEFP
jgi:hypothetical protein